MGTGLTVRTEISAVRRGLTLGCVVGASAILVTAPPADGAHGPDSGGSARVQNGVPTQVLPVSPEGLDPALRCEERMIGFATLAGETSQLAENTFTELIRSELRRNARSLDQEFGPMESWIQSDLVRTSSELAAIGVIIDLEGLRWWTCV